MQQQQQQQQRVHDWLLLCLRVRRSLMGLGRYCYDGDTRKRLYDGGGVGVMAMMMMMVLLL